MTPWQISISNLAMTKPLPPKYNWEKAHKTCACCGKTYQSTREESTYCSNKCRGEARRGPLKPTSTQVVMACVMCGKDFIRRHPKTKTCGAQCSHDMEVQRDRARKMKNKEKQ